MKLFLDTGLIDEIKAANDLGFLDGVTTNPSLVANSCIRDSSICNRPPVSRITTSISSFFARLTAD